MCVIDDVWTSVGSDNFNRRSWTSDSEIAAAVQDVRVESREGSAPPDAFALRMRRELVAEHVGLRPEDVPDDPQAVWDLMAASADALDEWYAAGGALRRRRHLPHPPHLPAPRAGGAVHWRRRHSRAAVGAEGVERPPGRLRRVAPPQFSRLQLLWASRVYGVVDPDGTLGRDDEI